MGSISLDGLNSYAKRGEIGYWAHPDARGHGVVTEAVRLVTRHARNSGLARSLMIRCVRGNLASQRVAERAGYIRIGVQPTSEPLGDGQLADLVLYFLPVAAFEALCGHRNVRGAVGGVLWENLRVTLQVSVIGTNYLGATHAAGMAEFGHQVIGVDIDVDRVKTLSAGQSHIFEVGLEPLLERHTASGRLRFTTDYTEIADWADVHFLALGTPSGRWRR